VAFLGTVPLAAQRRTLPLDLDPASADVQPPLAHRSVPLCTPAPTALVLGGGGAKGMAHLGVLAVLDSLGITPDLIVGTSAGAVLGAMWASGESAASIEARVRAARLDRIVRPCSPSIGPAFASARPLFVWERAGARWVVQDGAVRDEEADSALASLLAPAEAQARGDFDALPIPFRAVATDLRTREVVVLDRGRLIDAVRASMAIPVLLRPVPRDCRALVDGGLSANNPVAVARALGAHRVSAAVQRRRSARRDVDDFNPHQLRHPAGCALIPLDDDAPREPRGRERGAILAIDQPSASRAEGRVEVGEREGGAIAIGADEDEHTRQCGAAQRIRRDPGEPKRGSQLDALPHPSVAVHLGAPAVSRQFGELRSGQDLRGPGGVDDGERRRERCCGRRRVFVVLRSKTRGQGEGDAQHEADRSATPTRHT
jgi:predicted acylesterase/phospholipase RssA